MFFAAELGSPEENLSSKGTKIIKAKNKTPNILKITI